jgi:hypothetical protein
VRPNVEIVLWFHFERTEVVKEHKRPDAAVLERREYATYHHAPTEIVQSWFEYLDYWHIPALKWGVALRRRPSAGQ